MRRRTISFGLWVIGWWGCVFAGGGARAEAGGPARATARYTKEAPIIDGKLGDRAWASALWVDRFVQKIPSNGARPSRETAFAVLFDDTAIYMAVRCAVDSREEIVTRLIRRDREAEFDAVEITLSPRNDKKTGYAFRINPSGVMYDRYWGSDTTADAGWDAVWQAKTDISDTAWTIELAIPLDQLRIPEGRSVFGLQVSRWISGLKEQVLFSPVPDDKGGVISSAGILEGVLGLEAKLPFSISPESYLRVTRATEGLSNRREDGLSFGGGGYAKIGLRPDWIMDIAVLPDFGQVEVDEVVLNLTTYETQFPEKRPFFLEGAGLFTTPIQLFYSRRMGQPPAPELTEDESIVKGAALTPILGAVKLTGRTDRGLSLGAMDAVYLPTELRIENRRTGRQDIREGSPWANALVLRGLSEVGDASTIGVLGTALNPTGSDGAYAGGLDFGAVSTDRRHALRGQVAGNIRFDGVNGRAPTSGAAVWTQIGREGGEPIRYLASYQLHSKGFDINELGYMKRNDLHTYAVTVDHSWLRTQGLFKQIYTGGGVDGNWNLAGVRLYHSAWLWQSAVWRNNWISDYTVYGGPPFYDDRETRGGPPLWRPGFGGLKINFQSPEEKRVGLGITGELISRPYGVTVTGLASLYLRLGWLDMTLAARLKRTHGDLGYVDTQGEETPDETSVVGRQYLTELDLSIKGTVVFTRELTFQLQGQLFDVGVDYRGYSAVRPDGRLRGIDYRDAQGRRLEGDFARVDAVLQGLLRWEYHPGSTVFLIYTLRGEAEVTQPDAGLGEAFAVMKRGEWEHLFMVKLSWRFG